MAGCPSNSYPFPLDLTVTLLNYESRDVLFRILLEICSNRGPFLMFMACNDLYTSTRWYQDFCPKSGISPLLAGNTLGFSQNQHAVSVAEEAIMLPDRLLIALEH